MVSCLELMQPQPPQSLAISPISPIVSPTMCSRQESLPRRRYYSPFDDLFGLAALLFEPTSPTSTERSWESFEDSDSGCSSIFSEDPNAAAALISAQNAAASFEDSGCEYLPNISPTIPLSVRISPPPIRDFRHDTSFASMSYDDFLKTIEANRSPMKLPNINRSGHTFGRIGLESMKKTTLLPRYCVFCKNNGEEEDFFSNHVLKSDNGIIICPVLRAYTCPICHASGDYAHTIKYCPLGRDADWNGSKTTKGIRG